MKCLCCDNTFNLKRNKTQKYCSHDCSTIGQRKYATHRKCVGCGVEFEMTITKRKTQKYCSFECHKTSGNAANNSRLANERQCKNNNPTKPEQKLYAELDYLGVKYIRQHRIFHWTVDAYIPKTNMIIQVDGDYWHGNPEFQKDRPLDKRQTKRIGTDKSQNIWFEKSGYKLHRIWDSEIQHWETR